MKPKVFIGSSKESIDVAQAIQENLEDVAEPTVWNQDIFAPSRFVPECFKDLLGTMDYAVFVFSPDDKLKIRGQEVSVTRDNVIFELGLFVATLGRERVFLVVPRGIADFHIPSDLLGITTIGYESERSDKRLTAALGPACRQIKKEIVGGLARRSCGYLVRYVEREEPSFLGPECDARVHLERAYELLLYMLRNEKVEKFRAFDLAFERWEEILRPDNFQTFNISSEIFEATERMFSGGRCASFRRILVVSLDQLRKRNAAKVLRRIEEQERHWRAQYAVFVETRILIYPSKANSETRRRISHLHDFALFSGEEGKFAIIETTLTAPSDHVETPECRITNVERIIKEKEAGFEEFWESSQPLPIVLDRISGVDSEHDDKPAFKAYKRFFDAYPRIGDDCALIIEAGYFDLRTPEDPDRFYHLDDAFQLFESIHDTCQRLQGNIFLDAFINDFSEPYVCYIENCETAIDSDDESERVRIKSSLIENLKRRYKSYGFKHEDFEFFGMKRTRNAVADLIKMGLRNGSKKIWERDYKDTMIDIFISTLAEDICLGYRDAGSSGVIPRCTALIAQHYYDLYRFALKRKPDLKELWIFDFNRYTERESVRMGAEATFILHSWPSDFKLKIINCIYSADGKGGTIQEVP